MNTIVTGTTSGIGRALTDALRSAGHGVEEVNRDTVDMLNLRQVMRWRPATPAGELDLFVNNAGIMPLVDYAKTTFDQWDSIMAVNVRAPFFMTQRVIPFLRPGGCIVNIASVAGLQPDPEEIAYSMSKAALIMFSRCLARRLAGFVRVITILPGFVDTNLVPGELPEHLLMTIPMQRQATASEVAKVILDAVSWPYANGTMLVIDGGLLASVGAA